MSPSSRTSDLNPWDHHFGSRHHDPWSPCDHTSTFLSMRNKWDPTQPSRHEPLVELRGVCPALAFVPLLRLRCFPSLVLRALAICPGLRHGGHLCHSPGLHHFNMAPLRGAVRLGLHAIVAALVPQHCAAGRGHLPGLCQFGLYATQNLNFALSSLYPLPWSLYPFPAFAPFTLPSSQVHATPCCPSAGSPAHPSAEPPRVCATRPFGHLLEGATCAICAFCASCPQHPCCHLFVMLLSTTLTPPSPWWLPNPNSRISIFNPGIATFGSRPHDPWLLHNQHSFSAWATSGNPPLKGEVATPCPSSATHLHTCFAIVPGPLGPLPSSCIYSAPAHTLPSAEPTVHPCAPPALCTLGNAGVTHWASMPRTPIPARAYIPPDCRSTDLRSPGFHPWTSAPTVQPSPHCTTLSPSSPRTIWHLFLPLPFSWPHIRTTGMFSCHLCH